VHAYALILLCIHTIGHCCALLSTQVSKITSSHVSSCPFKLPCLPLSTSNNIPCISSRVSSYPFKLPCLYPPLTIFHLASRVSSCPLKLPCLPPSSSNNIRCSITVHLSWLSELTSRQNVNPKCRLAGANTESDRVAKR
jgi:hypothetical protein